VGRYSGAFLFPFLVSNPWTRPELTVTARPGLQVATVRGEPY
jgi:hypothetical protein